MRLHPLCNAVAGRRSCAAADAWIALAGAALLCLSLASSASAQDIAPPAQAHRVSALAKVMPARFNGDVRHLPQVAASHGLHSWNEFEEPPSTKKPGAFLPGAAAAPNIAVAAMPATTRNFEGIGFSSSLSGGTAGAGWPPDVNGDVGPNHYIEAVNDAYVIYTKTGTRLAAFTENALWSGAGTHTPCDANNQGDPVVLHDGLTDRWVLTNFAFAVSAGKPVAPFYQCFAVSQTADPVGGGWYLYAVRMDPGGSGKPPVGTLNDYGKFGLWSDCLYMSSNEFTASSGAYVGAAFASFSRADMYAGNALTGAIGMIANSTDPFTMIPSNLLGTSAASLPPAGTPDYFVSESQSVYAFEVRKFTAGGNCGAGGFLGAATNVSQTEYTVPAQDVVPQPGTSNTLDSLGDRLMQKVQYRRIGSTESLWVVHSTRTSATSTVRPQWAQIDVTSGNIATAPVQQQIYAPDSTKYRWMPALAVDGQGNMALGYSTSSSSSFPGIAYSGRLVGDPANNLPQTEAVLVAGAGAQTNTCGGVACQRWGDYTSMSVDPADDCTFWYVNQYYASAANGAAGNWQTRIGSFKFPSCATTFTVTPSVSGGNGTISPSTPQSVSNGATTSFTLAPSAGYHASAVTGTCGGSLAGTTYTTHAVTASCTVIASFAIDTFTVTPSVSGGNGTINPSTPRTVNSGATTSFTLAPSAGYHVAGVAGTCGGNLIGVTFNTNAISANCTVVASFAINTFSVTPSVSGGNGTISPSTPQTVNSGTTASFTLTPSANHHVASVAGTCGGSLVGSTYTTNAISANCTVVASFAIDTFTVTPSVSGGNGTLSPSTPQTVNRGATTSFSLSPSAGYHIAGVAGTCGGSLIGVTYTTNAITTDCTVVASFAIDTFSVTPGVSGGNGTISPSAPQTVNDGATTGFTLAANPGYAIGSVSGCGGSLDGSLFTTGAIHADCAVSATFNPPSQVAVDGGDNQAALVDTVFATALSARAADANDTPVAGVEVDFAASVAGNGASATLSAASAITDGNGIASVTATANAIVGSYAVAATVAGVGGSASFALSNVPPTDLSIDIDDGQDHAGYGRLLNYIVTVHNAGPADAIDVSVSNALPPQLDIAQAQWTCLGAAGATCTPAGTGALSDSGVVVPANTSLSWSLSAPVLPNATGDTVDNTVAVSSAADTNAANNAATDQDGLVLFRTGFEIGDDGVNSADWMPPLLTPMAQRLDADDAIAVTVPSGFADDRIQTLVFAQGTTGTLRIESLGFQSSAWVRLVIGGTEEQASAWTPVERGAQLVLQLVATADGWAVRVDGATKIVQHEVSTDPAMQPVYQLSGIDNAVR